MIFPESQSPVLNDSIDGLKFVETSDQWNKACEVLPCFAEMYWPGYATKCITSKVGDEDIVIQLWKGFCPQLFGSWGAFPGGIGAEVGIYRRVPATSTSKGSATKLVTKSTVKAVLDAKGPMSKINVITAKTGPILQEHARGLDKALAGFRHPLVPPRTAGDLWYPAPDLSTNLSWRLVHPASSTDPKRVGGDTLETFFETPFGFRNRKGYWCNRWMDRESYKRYQAKHKVPIVPTGFILEYRINGQLQPRW